MKALQGSRLHPDYLRSCASVAPVNKEKIAQENDKVLGFEQENLGHRPKKKTSRNKVMSSTVEARVLMQDAWPTHRFGKLDNIFYHAVRFISPRVEKEFTPRRARSIWEGTARRIDSDEMDALRAAIIEEAHREQQELRARLAALDKKVAAFAARTSGRPVAGAGE